MKAHWIQLTPKKAQQRIGDFFLNLEEQPDGEVWQYALWSQGKHTVRPFDVCKVEWAREVIASAREALDQFEAKLTEEDNETSVQERSFECGPAQAGSGAA